jgi:hypothetical protein
MRTKTYLFEVLKNNFKSSKYVFEFIGCQIMPRNFSRNFGAFIFLDIKNDFSLFSGIIYFLKNRLLQKIKYLQTLAIYIWLEDSRRDLSKSQNSFPRFDPPFPKLLAEVRGVSNSSDPPFIPALSIHQSDLLFAINRPIFLDSGKLHLPR